MHIKGPFINDIIDQERGVTNKSHFVKVMTKGEGSKMMNSNGPILNLTSGGKIFGFTRLFP